MQYELLWFTSVKNFCKHGPVLIRDYDDTIVAPSLTVSPIEVEDLNSCKNRALDNALLKTVLRKDNYIDPWK